MADLNVIYRIAADITGLQDGVKRAADATEGLETTVGRVGKAIVGAFSVGKVVEFGRVTTQAFAEEEAALRKLETALIAQGNATPVVTKQYADLATQFQKTTVFSDDLVLEMEALLVQVGNVMPDQMEGALTAATNLAAGLGVDLRTATLLMGKAFEGETGTLKRYGIVIDESKLKTEGASAVLEAINDKFGGQAQAQIQTYSGKVAQLNNNMSDAQETIGGVVTKGLTPMISLFNALPTSLQTVVGGVSALTPSLEQLTLGLIAIGGPAKVGAMFLSMWGAVAPLLATAGTAILAIGAGPLTIIVGAIAAVLAAWYYWDEIKVIVQNVYTAVKTWLVDKFQAIVDSIKAKIDAVTGFFKNMYDKVSLHSYVPDMIKDIATEFGKLNSAMVDPSKSAASAVTGVFSKLVGDLGGILGNFGRAAGDWLDGMIGKLSTRWQSAIGGIMSGVGSLSSGGSTADAIGSVSSAAVTAGLGAYASGASIAGSVALGATTMGIGLAAVGVYKGISALMSQNEHKAVNDLRDTWFGGRGVQDVGDALQNHGVDSESARKMIANVFAAKKKSDFASAAGAIDRAIGLARGGLVMQPTLAMVGERGPELVTPLDRLGGLDLGNSRELSALSDEVAGLRGDLNRLLRVMPRLTVTAWKDAQVH